RNEGFCDEEAVDRSDRRSANEPQRQRAGDAEGVCPAKAGDENADEHCDEIGDRDKREVELADGERERRGHGEEKQARTVVDDIDQVLESHERRRAEPRKGNDDRREDDYDAPLPQPVDDPVAVENVTVRRLPLTADVVLDAEWRAIGDADREGRLIARVWGSIGHVRRLRKIRIQNW